MLPIAKELGYFEELEKAKEKALPNEELRIENFNKVNTEGFEGLVVVLKHWHEMIFNAMFQKKSFRIELIYNAENKKTSFAIYTPAKAVKDGNK